jgi:hypothetical protein
LGLVASVSVFFRFFAAAMSNAFRLVVLMRAQGPTRNAVATGAFPWMVAPKADLMKKAKFVQDAKLDPSRYYRNPSDVIRDRRLTNQDRLEILAAWERDARDGRQNEDLDPGEVEEVLQVRRLREELERTTEAVGASAPGLGRSDDQA